MSASGEDMSSVSVARRTSAVSSFPSPENERSPELLAARILSRERGVVAGESPVRLALGAFGALVKRLLALPGGALAGVWVGTLIVPALLFVRMGWIKKIWLVVLSPLLGLWAGSAIGWRVLSRGRVEPTALVARLLHRFCPIFTLPKALTHNALGLVVVTRHRDVRTVLERDDVFRVDIYGEKMRATSGAFFLGMDAGPDYDREQKLGKAALGRDEGLIKECVGRLSQALIDGALERPSRTLDVVNEFVHVVQLNLIKEYFGVPDTHDERLLDWLETMSFFIFNFWVSGPYKTASVAAGQAMEGHLRQIVRDRLNERTSQRETKNDVLGRMLVELETQSGQAPLDQNLVVRTMGGLVSGGTVAAIGTFVRTVDRLLDLPAGLRKQLQEAALIGNDVTVRRFVREAARFSAYPPTLYRHACQPYVFGAGTSHEKEAEEGAWVVTAPITANFDASVFRRPEVFDPNRNESNESAPLLYGWSRHRCLGEHMAELVMGEMAKRLFARNVRRARGAAGRVTNGPAGTIPGGSYARRLIVRFC